MAWLDHGNAKCAFTIHNLNYGADLIGQVGCHAAARLCCLPACPAMRPHGCAAGCLPACLPAVWGGLVVALQAAA